MDDTPVVSGDNPKVKTVKELNGAHEVEVLGMCGCGLGMKKAMILLKNQFYSTNLSPIFDSNLKGAVMRAFGNKSNGPNFYFLSIGRK